MLALHQAIEAAATATCRGASEEQVREALAPGLLLLLPALFWHRAQCAMARGQGEVGGGYAEARLASAADRPPVQELPPQDVLWDMLWHERFGGDFGLSQRPAWAHCAMRWKERYLQALLLALAEGFVDALPQPRRSNLRALLAEAVVSADCSGLSSVTDACLQRLLLGCPLLQRLNLKSTPVSDAGLRALHQCCPRLCWLRLSGTSVTRDGVYDLLSRRPKLSIVM